MKQIKALGISQAGLLFELTMSVTLKGMAWALWLRQQKERETLGHWSQLSKETETCSTRKAAAPPSMQSTSARRASQEGTT